MYSSVAQVFDRLLKRFSRLHSFGCTDLDLYISTGFLDQKKAWHDGKCQDRYNLEDVAPPLWDLRTPFTEREHDWQVVWRTWFLHF